MPQKNKSPLRKLRELFGLTQSEVADAIGVAQSTLARIETDPSYQTRKQDALALVEYFGRALTFEHVLFPDRHPEFLSAPKARVKV